MLLQRIFTLFLFLGLVSCTASNNEMTYEQAEMTVQEKEQKFPLQFLTLSESNHGNLLGQTVFECDVANAATIVPYKDFVVKIDFYTKTNTLISSEERTIYESVSPGRSVHFKIKLDAPSETDKVAVNLTNASIYTN